MTLQKDFFRRKEENSFNELSYQHETDLHNKTLANKNKALVKIVLAEYVFEYY